jgi:hypothetical protein
LGGGDMVAAGPAEARNIPGVLDRQVGHLHEHDAGHRIDSFRLME